MGCNQDCAQLRSNQQFVRVNEQNKWKMGGSVTGM
jgi:hypothetical protein